MVRCGAQLPSRTWSENFSLWAERDYRVPGGDLVHRGSGEAGGGGAEGVSLVL